jgi:histone deacetylase complex subunit SAP30
VYRLETPSAFKNPLAHLLLSQGIGKYSPTYARIKSQRRVSKDHLARAVRKNFNAMAVNEVEVIVDMLYKVKTKGIW